jgi:hypothetical protein
MAYGTPITVIWVCNKMINHILVDDKAKTLPCNKTLSIA